MGRITRKQQPKKQLGVFDTPKKKKSTKIAVTYRLPERAKQAVMAKVIDDGYGMKGKSIWVSEAIERFMKEQSWKDQVLDVDMVPGNDSKDVVYLEPRVKRLIHDARRQVLVYAAQMTKEGRRQEMLDILEVNQTAIIRAAIIYRLYCLKMPIVEAAPEFDFEEKRN